ncbi:hypothetical protein MJO28_003138 [Puccinia striiformis f. sp. tritici]|uniref:Uncharacterized protein n=2 Tax=Puccinia striiformis TaxID=27350 RepID=A0A2S4WIN8_9BASI|nr:hypothetical protein MJO28_003138 [Puccinia striiformis f. sp. tritici]POW21614.1 hypothetical protein PSHT_02172 [Puccinia striiformis]
MRINYHLASGVAFLSLCAICKGVSLAKTLVLPKVTDRGAAGDLQELQDSIRVAKGTLYNVGLGMQHQNYLDELASRVVMINYLLVEKYRPLLATRELQRKIFGADQGPVAQGCRGDSRGRGERVLSNLVMLLASSPIPQGISRDDELHEFRKTIFLGIRLMIKHDLVKDIEHHPIFQDKLIAQLLWRCGLIGDELRKPRQPEAFPTIFTDPFWRKMINSFRAKIFKEATRDELKRVSARLKLRENFRKVMDQKEENRKVKVVYPQAIVNILDQ